MELKVGDLIRTIDRYPTRDGMLGYVLKVHDVFVKIELTSSHHHIARYLLYPKKDIKLAYQLEFEWT